MPFQKGNKYNQMRKVHAGPSKKDRYASTFARTEKFLDDHIDEWVQTLSALGLGKIRAVDAKVDKDGNVVERVYEVPPDRAALQYLIDRHLYKPSTLEDAMLGTARVESEREKVALITAQTATQIEQAEYTRVQTEAFRRSVITPDMAETLVRGTMQYCIALLQGLSDTDWQDCGDYVKRQNVLFRIAEKLTERAEEDIETLEAERLTIPARFVSDMEEAAEEGA